MSREGTLQPPRPLPLPARSELGEGRGEGLPIVLPLPARSELGEGRGEGPLRRRRRRPAPIALTDDERAELLLVREAIVSGKITPTAESLFYKYYTRHLSGYEPSFTPRRHD